jgi:hypothetical protein
VIEKFFNFKSEDDKIVFHRIFHVGCKFADITFHGDEVKKNEIIDVLKELIIKLTKVVDEIRLFQSNKLVCEKELLIEIQRDISAVPTHELARNLENFLTLAKGTLDIFAKQFLRIMLCFDGKWNCKKLIKHLQNQSNLDQSIVEQIINTLKKENKEWLKDFIDDRNLHHEKNIGLSSMSVVNGHPFIKLTRRNGKIVTDIIAYLQYHYNKLFHLIEYLMRFSFCAINPAWKVVYLSEWTSSFNHD